MVLWKPEKTIKCLEENIVHAPLTSILAIYFLISLLRQGAKANEQRGLQQTKTLLQNEGNYQQNEMAAYWMGKDICKMIYLIRG